MSEINTDKPPADHVGRIEQQWKRELPDVSLEGLRILARARRITLAVSPRIDAVLAAHGLDAGQFYVLTTLRRAGAPYSLRPTEIFRSLMITSGGLTDRLRRLEALGMITREPDPEDGRSMLARLTTQGKQVVESAFRQDMAIENEIVSVLSPGERARLAALLAKLAQSFENSG